MKIKAIFSIITFSLLVLLAGTAAADRLPNQTPENQVFTMASSVELTGSYSGSQNLQWTTGFDPVQTNMYVYNMLCSPVDVSVYLPLHAQLIAGGGSDVAEGPFYDNQYFDHYHLCSITVPENMLDTPAAGVPDNPTYREWGASFSWDRTPEDVYTAGGHGGLHTGILDPNEVRATTAYSEMTETNGGYVSETKTFDPDTRNKAVGLFNVESTKTFTYATDANTGSIAQTAEMIATDNMGAPTATADVVACPFGPSQSEIYPSFCNVVYAKSMSQGVTSAAQSSSAQVRMVAASADTPAELNYNFDVKPDASAGVGYAMGTFGTEFGVSIKEGRGNGSAPSATLVYTDKATVAGMVAKLTKQYASKSGFSL